MGRPGLGRCEHAARILSPIYTEGFLEQNLSKYFRNFGFSYPRASYFDRENQMADMGKQPKGRPLAVDPSAASASPTEPAFIARPVGAPVYHGFQILDGVVVQGFTFGKITDFEAEPCQEGDAFVVAPDNSRAGLVWEVGEKVSVSQISPLESGRWGVWAVSFPHPMNSRENVRRNLELIVPSLKEKWNEWREKFPEA